MAVDLSVEVTGVAWALRRVKDLAAEAMTCDDRCQREVLIKTEAGSSSRADVDEVFQTRMIEI